jgi:hypothetical protein
MNYPRAVRRKMSNKIKSNKPNITFSSNIFDYDNFEKNVLQWESLVKLTNKIKFNKTEMQEELYGKGAMPYFCNNNDERAWGFIKTEKGEIVQSCRCEKKSCVHFKKCMKEEYAKKIVRNNAISIIDKEVLVHPKWRELRKE